MNQKNRELARRNTELLEEISRLTDIHSDILKENIKEKYYRTRMYKRLIEQIDNQIAVMKDMLEGCMSLKESLVQIVDVREEKESDTNVFKQSMKMLDTICEQEQTVPTKTDESTPLKEVSQNKSSKRKRRSGL